MRFDRLFAGTVVVMGLAVFTAAGQTPEASEANLKVLVSGENPSIRLLDKEGGKIVTNVNFWRADWSPVGPGAVCFVTVDAPGKDRLRIAISDNDKLTEYAETTLMGSLVKNFNDPPFTPLHGTITQTNVGATQRTETCKSKKYTVKLVWKDLQPGEWVSIKPGGKTYMTFVRVRANGGGEVWINGKRAPGTSYPTVGGRPGASLTVGETWRR